MEIGILSEPAIILVAFVVAIIVGHIIVKMVLGKFDIGTTDDKGLEGAGAIIGILERFFTLTFVLAGEFTAIALIFTAKSIARFEELKNRPFSEYYLIGTLTSILVAVIVGILAEWCLDLV